MASALENISSSLGVKYEVPLSEAYFGRTPDLDLRSGDEIAENIKGQFGGDTA